MTLSISGIPDDGSIGTSEILDSSDGLVVSSIEYSVAGQKDSVQVQDIYGNGRACIPQLQFVRSESIEGTCSARDGSGTIGRPVERVEITGTFSCGNLSNNETGRSVQANHGSFYCTRTKTKPNVCGGGGGGGDGPVLR